LVKIGIATMAKRLAPRDFFILFVVALLLFPEVLGYLQSKVKLEFVRGQNRAGVILHKKPPLGVLDDTNKEDNGKYASFGSTKDGNIDQGWEHRKSSTSKLKTQSEG